MNERETLERFLRTDPRDVGCSEAIAVLHVYADLIAAGQNATDRYPGVAAHLAACGPWGARCRRLRRPPPSRNQRTARDLIHRASLPPPTRPPAPGISYVTSSPR